MPRIFDNIETQFHPALAEALKLSGRADFCVGYFNLRGWKTIADLIEDWPGGEGACCRVIAGMERLAEDRLAQAFRLSGGIDGMDNTHALRLRQQVAASFREQLTIGAPTASDEKGLRQLARQLRGRKVVVKLFLRHTLHAKLYLTYRADPLSPRTGFVGSSNLTFTGLKLQGELNVDVKDDDATAKLENWFNQRWDDRFAVDITDELADIIEQSWASETLLPPYYIYLKMAYHLSQDARAGLAEHGIPKDLAHKLLPFQSAAVRIAAHHVKSRGGVLLGDVVGLGKTLMASALARVMQEEEQTDTLFIVPPHLTSMWDGYRTECRLLGKVLAASRVLEELPDLRRYRLVVIDESQNLRNPDGKRYRAIRDYIARNEPWVVLLSATPYNKTYLDLGAQLRLFLKEDRDLGMRPERLLQEIGETEFIRRHQCSPRSIAGFEKSEYPDDWRDLMRLFMVRRTRTFIKENYALTDASNGREYLSFESGDRFYFPTRIPHTVRVPGDRRRNDPYARMHAPAIVASVEALRLPRYGLGAYISATPADPAEAEVLARLGRAGRRLIGFSRTGLFKRLESGGPAFIQSLERHILRNYLYLHAIDHGEPLPVGTQSAETLALSAGDRDTEQLFQGDDDTDQASASLPAWSLGLRSESDFQGRAAEVYAQYRAAKRAGLRWVRPAVFSESLRIDLVHDCEQLLGILGKVGQWDASKDTKLALLEELIEREHPGQKVLIFTAFADTANYLEGELRRRGVTELAAVTGDSSNPTEMAHRFSPISNHRPELAKSAAELRVLLATDVLSEGQNLQDCAVVVNFDLPWALVNLIQRAGRVDRIGQRAPVIHCYSFEPSDGVENILRLRQAIRRRLRENGEVVGSDEAFFEEDLGSARIVNLYHEKSGALDDEVDVEVDLASQAYEIWHGAIKADPKLEATIADLPNVVYSTKSHAHSTERPFGVLTYVRTGDDYDALAWVDESGVSVTESQAAILAAAACGPDTPALPRQNAHHELVRSAVEQIRREDRAAGGQLGRPSGARFKTYERLNRYAVEVSESLFSPPGLEAAIQDLYDASLTETAKEILNRRLRESISDEELAALAIQLRSEDKLTADVGLTRSIVEARIICSMGLAPSTQPGPHE
jgi:Helicase conserved C-terminal domain/PLD-like domain